MKSIYRYIVFLTGIMVACEPNIDEFQPDHGTADLSRIVALGDSYIAGFADNELYLSGQESSIANIVASQLQLAGGNDFKQPLMVDEYGFGRKKVLGYKTDCYNNNSLIPVPAGVFPDLMNFANISAKGPYQNLGVPGTKSFHMLLPSYGSPSSGNPYYLRFASEPGYSTMAGDAASQDPTFFLLGAGAYDVLRYALSGGTTDSITSLSTYEMVMTDVVQTLARNGADGAILNVPDITGLPYFTTINLKLSYNGFVLTAEQALQLNSAYIQIEAYLASNGIIYDYPFTFQEGANPFIVQDGDIQLPPPFNVRAMNADDRFLLNLPTDSIACFGWCVPTMEGPNGIPQRYVLSKGKRDEIDAAVEAYNAILDNLASMNGLVLIDMKGFFKEMETGKVYAGIILNNVFVSGGFYSLDGLHLSKRGNAATANFIIDELNRFYEMRIPKVNIGDYQGIVFP